MAHGGVLTSLATLEGEVATNASDGVVLCCDLWLLQVTRREHGT